MTQNFKSYIVSLLISSTQYNDFNIFFFPVYHRGNDFRQDYSRLAMLCATFPGVPVVALTATAGKEDILAIKASLNLKNPLEIVGNPNRPNIMYNKIFRKGDDVDFYEELLKPMTNNLKQSTVAYPLTILYLPLKWCGFAYKYFDK